MRIRARDSLPSPTFPTTAEINRPSANPDHACQDHYKQLGQAAKLPGKAINVVRSSSFRVPKREEALELTIRGAQRVSSLHREASQIYHAFPVYRPPRS